MKRLIMLCIPCLILLFSCGDDDSGCSQSDYIGTWTGSESCTVGGDNNVTITIIEKGSDIEIDGGEFVTDELNVSGCTVSRNNTTFGIGFEYSGSLNDDGVLSLEHRQVGGGATLNLCTYTLTKQ